MPRNSSGNYTLPAGNPVTPNTLIETAWANPTMSDIAASITDSLDRYGRGGMLAPLKLADGTAVQPAFAFNAESSTGLFRDSAGVMGVSVLGSAVALFAAGAISFLQPPSWAADPTTANQLTRKSYVDAAISTGLGNYLPLTGGTLSGNLTVNAKIGINANPSYFLDLAANGSNAIALRFQGAASQSPLYVHAPADLSNLTMQAGTSAGVFSAIEVISWNGGGNAPRLGFYTAGAERMRINAAGQLLAGSGTAPSGGSVRALFANPGTATIQLADTSTGGGGLLGGLGGGGQVFYTYTGAVGAETYTERMRIDAAGKVGIGTAAPGVALHVYSPTGGASPNIQVETNANSDAAFRAKTALGYWGAGVGIGAAANCWNIYDFNAGAERMRIDSAGLVGIGGAPLYQLDVQGANASIRISPSTATNAALLRLTNGGGNAFIGLDNSIGSLTGVPYCLSMFRSGAFPIVLSTNDTERMRIDSAGNVGIGISSPSATGGRTLEVFGTGGNNATFVANGNNGAVRADFQAGQADSSIGTITNHNFYFKTNGTQRAQIDSAGVFTYGGIEVGYKDLPNQFAGIVRGKAFSTGANQTITTQPAGTLYAIFNNSGGPSITLTGSGVTLTLGGTGTTGVRTLARNGMAHVWFYDATNAVIFGTGVS